MLDNAPSCTRKNPRSPHRERLTTEEDGFEHCGGRRKAHLISPERRLTSGVTIAGITAYARRAAHAASDAINASEAPQAPGRIATKINRGPRLRGYAMSACSL